MSDYSKLAHDVLKQYWGYDSFRPVQEDIIISVLEGKDTLALLPTGGGKSVCFQVPAILLEGVCIVVTPLIALMKDQVEQLNKRGVKAQAIYSGMSSREIDLKLDNCVYGDIKFLYVSPERLQTDIFQERLKKMTVGLLAVDEAHCISQWGYDFRPSYLHIAEVRALIPEVAVIALTATATPEVQEDIQEKLEFKAPLIYQKSFARDNLSYSVRHVEDKERKMLEVLNRVPGTAIVYTRTRKGTKELAQLLMRQGISADFYHAGLTHEQRTAKQDAWINNKTRVIVSTNAFGMGIDKPDVRVVIHMEMPPDLESYYQEAGRGGRDEKKAFAVVIYENADLTDLREKVARQYPSIELIKRVYQCLANYYKMAVGSGNGQSFDFDIQTFADNYQLNHMDVYYSLKQLEDAELISFNESFFNPSRVHIRVDNRALYEFQIANAKFDLFIKALLRIYGGELFSNYVKISEVQVAQLMAITESEVQAILERLASFELITYDKKKEKPQIVFVAPRQDASRLKIDKVRLEARKETAVAKAEAMIAYTTNSYLCRTQQLLDYFGETYGECGICDVCVNKKQHKEDHSNEYRTLILHEVKLAPETVEKLLDRLTPADKEEFLEIVRIMVDAGELVYDDKWRLMMP